VFVGTDGLEWAENKKTTKEKKEKGTAGEDRQAGYGVPAVFRTTNDGSTVIKAGVSAASRRKMRWRGVEVVS
jgi:hypothetical protein